VSPPASPQPLPERLRHWVRANPLLLLALAAVCGILAAEKGWLDSHSLWLPSAAVLLSAAAVLGARSWLLPPACILVFAFVHSTRLDETFRHPLRLALQHENRPVQALVRGSLLPEYDNTSDQRAHALCTAQSIEIPAAGLMLDQTATVLVRLPKGVLFPGPGLYELHGSLQLPRTASNPGAFDAQEYSLRLGRVARLDVTHMLRLGGTRQTPWCSFLEAAEACRQWISTQLAHDLEDDPQTVAVLRAMALGMSADADDETAEAFRNSGTLHVFAVSGMQVGLLGVIALLLLRQLGIRRGLAMVVALVLVFAYAFVTGWRPSASRSAFMVAMFLGATLVDRESSLQNSLGAAALLLLGSDPHQLFMPGFQLSFGVLWFSAVGSVPLLEKLLPLTQLDPFLPPQLASWSQRTWSHARLWLARTLSVSFAAWIGSLPFILVHFQSVTPVAVLANCVLVPLSTLCLGATCMSLCAAGLHLGGAQIMLNNANWALAKAMTFSAAWFASLPGASFHLQPDSAFTHTPASLSVLELPFGGAACHLRVGGRHWLLDTGSEASFTRVLRPCLHAGGVNSLDGVFLSHDDADHIGAIGPVLAAFHEPKLYCSTLEPTRRASPYSTLRRLLAPPHPPALHKLAAGETIPLSAAGSFTSEAQLLYPTPQVHSERGDDRAMVLMLHLGPWRVLWLSDAGWSTEKNLCSSGADLRCDVLIRSQHEVDLATSPEFLIKAAPQIILCGSDARATQTAPSPAVQLHARSQNIPLLDTWDTGGIDLQFDLTQLHISTHRSHQHLVLKPRP
jgi:competence protein ComEC